MDPQLVAQIAISLVVLLLSLSVHEASHAFAAFRLGDRTAESQGRMSLNPLAHIDPFGTILFPLMGMIFHLPVFGWAKPVPVNPVRFTHRLRMKTGMLIVSAAGPLSNLLLALLGALLLGLAVRLAPDILVSTMGGHLITFVHIMILLNIYLAFFNLLPIPPLDGSKILYGLLPDRYGAAFLRIEPYAVLVLLLLLFTGGLDILARPAMGLFNLLMYLATAA